MPFIALPVHGFSFDVEILYIAARAGLSIAEIPVNWKDVSESKVNLVIDSPRMLADIVRFRIRHRGTARHRNVEEELTPAPI